MVKVEKGRIYSPAEDGVNDSTRHVVYPETSIEQIVTRSDGTNLKDDIGPKIVISSNKSLGNNEPSLTGRNVIHFFNKNEVEKPIV